MECLFPEHVLVMAHSQGIHIVQRPTETVLAFASRVMNVDEQHVRFTLAGRRLHAHYNYPDLLEREPFEYALELNAMGISEHVLGNRVLPLNRTALYNILLFCKQSNPVYARGLLQSQVGARIAASWSFIPTRLTLLMLGGNYSSAVSQTIAGTPASLCNPNWFSIADFACKRASTRQAFDKALLIIATERLAPTQARTYRILLSKYKLGEDSSALFNHCILDCVVALKKHNLCVHKQDVEYVFNRLKSLADTCPDNVLIKRLCNCIVPLLIPHYLQIIFVPTSNTPWWFLQLFYVHLLSLGVTFTRYLQSVQTLTIANATAILLPFRPEYNGRWQSCHRAAVNTTYQELLQIPMFTIWQATTINLQRPLARWTPVKHSQWSFRYQRAVFVVVACSYRRNCLVSVLPPELILFVFKFCFLHDFRL